MTNEENIRAILETNFAGYKDEIIDVAVKKIIGLLDKHDEEVIKDTVESIWGEPCEDCVRRESVIEWLKDKDIIKTKNQEENARRELVALPSVTPTDILDKIRDEIKGKIEQEEFARSVFRHEEKDTVKAEQCTGSIMAYNNVIKSIDKYRKDGGADGD